MLVAKLMRKLLDFDSFLNILKCLQPEEWAALYCTEAQGNEKGCCGVSVKTARAVPHADKTNIAS